MVINMSNKEKAKEFLKNNYGYITTSDFFDIGISKPLIQKFINEGIIKA